MTAQTPAPNDDAPRVPQDQDADRNDPAIDPQGNTSAEAPASTDSEDENSYAPDDIEPESDAARERRLEKEDTDADIDTDGG